MTLLPHKISTLFVTLALGIAVAGYAARAADAPPPGPDGQKTKLGEKMKIISKSVKQLKNQITDTTKQQSSIDLAQAAENAAKDAKDLAPAKAATIPEADRPKFIADYQAQMDLLIKDFDAITSDLTAGKYDDAQKVFNDLGQLKKDGHKQFQIQEN